MRAKSLSLVSPLKDGNCYHITPVSIRLISTSFIGHRSLGNRSKSMEVLTWCKNRTIVEIQDLSQFGVQYTDFRIKRT